MQILFSRQSISYTIAFSSLLISKVTTAQITPDNTLGIENSRIRSDVDIQEKIVDLIEGGAIRDANLFHSFLEFNVGEGQQVFFANPENITNIFSRITGNNPSEIFGTLGVDGNANLFLLNPNGIVFGENASLNVNGSFFATTADSINFADGTRFSATDSQTEPLLTVSIPVGLQFGTSPENIVNRSFATDSSGELAVGLQVQPENTLALVGGEVSVEGGIITAESGRIEIGSVAGNNLVSLNATDKGWKLDYQGVLNFQDISLSDLATVDASGNGGDIQVVGKNIILSGDSLIFSSTTGSQPGGTIQVIASDSINMTGDFTAIFTDTFGTGKAGDIQANAKVISIRNGAFVASQGNLELSEGQGGNITVVASELLEVIGTTTDGLPTSIFNRAEVGDGGNITIETKQLQVREEAQILASTFGEGDAGEIRVSAQTIDLVGITTGANFPSGILAQVEPGATGNGGSINIETGKITILDAAQISTAARSTGQGGNITINASEFIVLKGTSSEATLTSGQSGIFVSAEPAYEDESGNLVVTTGDAGNLNITTGRLTVEDGAKISADNFGTGKGGTATLNVGNLIIKDGGLVRAGSLLGEEFVNTERGAGGTLTINATESVEITGTGKIGDTPVNSTLLTQAEGTGNAGNLNLTTPTLTISNGADINVSATGRGQAGSANINAQDINLNNGRITAETRTGDQGNIVIREGNSLVLRNNSQITTNATEAATGGNITITSDVIALLENSEITANAIEGRGGDITITTQGLFQDSDSQITATSEFGLDGDITIRVLDADPAQSLTELPTTIVDASRLIGKSCLAGDEQNEFVVTGRGGLPTNPNESLRGDALLSAQWVKLPQQEGSENNSSNIQARGQESQVSLNNVKVNKTQPLQDVSTTQEIIEAKGWIIGANGKVILTAKPTPVGSVDSTSFIPHSCTN